MISRNHGLYPVVCPTCPTLPTFDEERWRRASASRCPHLRGILSAAPRGLRSNRRRLEG